MRTLSAIAFRVGALLLALAAAGSANTFFVTTNTDDSTPGSGSLRDAITPANAGATNPRVINFSIPGGGVQTSTRASALPAIARVMTLDGTMQPGYAGAPLIVIDGNHLDAN